MKLIVLALITPLLFLSGSGGITQSFACSSTYQKLGHDYQKESNYADYIAGKITSGTDDAFLEQKIKEQQLTLSLAELKQILHSGFSREIFCKPWPLHRDEILRQLFAGHFTNALRKGANPKLSQLLHKIKHSWPSPFPHKISLRDGKSKEFTNNFYYYLNPHDHLIYVKPNYEIEPSEHKYLQGGELHKLSDKESLGNTAEWNLFDRVGGPLSLLDADEFIAEIAAASDIVIAKTNKDRYYFYQPTYAELPSKWRREEGVLAGELFAPFGQKSWSLNTACAVRKEYRRTSEFMHPRDIVEYYTDGAGQKIALGFCATLFSLDKDGHTLSYWDTGLPANFSRFILSPQKGDFTIDGFSSAGSTLFVTGTDREGKRKMFTRLFDYDVYGGNPTLQNYYEVNPTKEQLASIQNMHLAHRKFPLPGWSEVSPIFKDHKSSASASNKITIITTGQGDDARELRVAGRNSKGEEGYYHKALKDTHWRFHKSKESLLSNSNPYTYQDQQQGAPSAFRYCKDYPSGKIEIKGKEVPEISSLELLDYHYFLTAGEPGVLRVKLRDGKSFDLEFHTLDAWTPFAQKKRCEQLIGQVEGEPKALMGTLVIADAAAAANPTIKKYFGPYNKLTNALQVIADDHEVKVKMDGVYRNSINSGDYLALPPMKMRFIRDDSHDEATPFFQELITQEELLLKNTRDQEKLQLVIKKNQALLQRLRDLQASIPLDGLSKAIANKIVDAILLPPINGITDITGITESVPFMGSISKITPKLFASYASINFQNFKKGVPPSLKDAIQTLEKRIKNYEVFTKQKQCKPAMLPENQLKQLSDSMNSLAQTASKEACSNSIGLLE
ncbi:MAG: hypothetical protein HQK50_16205 [Oligoflexia bacterium]|nr:hypothetical protein [Oligoflexia bacterium]